MSGGASTAEQSVAPDRAAILVLRDTSPLQAARQVNAVVPPCLRRVPVGELTAGGGQHEALLNAPDASV